MAYTILIISVLLTWITISNISRHLKAEDPGAINRNAEAKQRTLEKKVGKGIVSIINNLIALLFVTIEAIYFLLIMSYFNGHAIIMTISFLLIIVTFIGGYLGVNRHKSKLKSLINVVDNLTKTPFVIFIGVRVIISLI